MVGTHTCMYAAYTGRSELMEFLAESEYTEEHEQGTGTSNGTDQDDAGLGGLGGVVVPKVVQGRQTTD